MSRIVELDTPVEFIKGVGPRKAETLKKEAGIVSVKDMLEHYPFRYIDRTRFYKISEIRDLSSQIQIKGTLGPLETVGFKNSKRLVANFNDGERSVELVWFKGIQWIKDYLQPGKEYVLFGKPSLFRKKMNFAHPELELASEFTAGKQGLWPVYNSSEKMKKAGLDSKGIQKVIRAIFENLSDRMVPENLSREIVDKYRFISRPQALRMIHLPSGQNEIRHASRRLKFEELFFLQLGIVKLQMNRSKTPGFVFDKVGELVSNFYRNNLPFELTGAQQRVIKQIRTDCQTGFQMNRLLQGDVGSGKTIVAVFAALIAIESGFQASIMAPTAILAQQHYESITSILEGLPVKVALLTGSTAGPERKQILVALREGLIDILIGTHALLEDRVRFANLGLVIIDEQHRFGVAQRAKLWEKGKLEPHILIMTATPIPRTLAMTMYGDLEVSVIDELPPGRKPIKTIHKYESGRLQVFDFIRKEISKGRQVYIVYPLIEESEKLDLNDLMAGYESICRAFPKPEYQVSIVHGKMKPADKELEMQRFVKGETHIMVSTTVIEVGVNVPNASIMVIENAERFGLSQLHQLRGRVGRGAEQSYCILMSKYELTAEGRKRLKTMVETNDGFRIAEVDLELRGPGDLAGTQQSGELSYLKLTNLSRDSVILEEARKTAKDILGSDPELTSPANGPIREYYVMYYRKNKIWSRIS